MHLNTPGCPHKEGVQNVMQVINGKANDLTKEGKSFLQTDQALYAFAKVKDKHLGAFQKIQSRISTEAINKDSLNNCS